MGGGEDNGEKGVKFVLFSPLFPYLSLSHIIPRHITEEVTHLNFLEYAASNGIETQV